MCPKRAISTSAVPNQGAMAGVEDSLRAAEACLPGQPKEALQHCKTALKALQQTKADEQRVQAFL